MMLYFRGGDLEAAIIYKDEIKITIVRRRRPQMSCCEWRTMSEDASVSGEAEIRIMLVGRAGKGKTCSARTILGQKDPDPDSEYSATDACHRTTAVVHGHRVVVIDTPGLAKPNRPDEAAVKEMKQAVRRDGRGPHVFLYVMKVNDGFTAEERDAVKTVCRTFGENTMAYTMVLFTCGEELEDDDVTVEDYISRGLEDLIIQCHWKYHVFENTNQNPDQVFDLLQKIRNMTERSRGSFYTAEMLQKAEEASEEQQQQQQQQQQQAQTPPSEKSGSTQAVHRAGGLGICAGCLLGYFAGGGEMSSTIGAAVGALSGGLLGVTTTGLALYAKKHFHKST